MKSMQLRATQVAIILFALWIAGCGTDDQPLAPSTTPRMTNIAAPHTPVLYVPPTPPSVPQQMAVRVAVGHTIAEINTTFATSTLDQIPGSEIYLLDIPQGLSPEALADALLLLNLCDLVEQNYMMQSPEAEGYMIALYEGEYSHEDYVDQDALLRIGAPAAHLEATGAGILVAVIDTGIDLDHPDLIDNIGPGYDLIDGDTTPEDLPNGIDEDGDGFFDEAAGHGTHVAGIVAAVAPDVTILPYRVLDSEGWGNIFDVANAIYMAVEDGAQVINLSIGMEGESAVLAAAIHDAEDADVLIVASAGNQGVHNPNHYPASDEHVMAVTATDASDIKAVFANYGPYIDISAPGVGIMSTYWNGGYAIWSGTSMATPFIAGAAAVGLEIAPALGEEIGEEIEDNSLDLDASGHAWLEMIGEGRLLVDEMAWCLVLGGDCDE